MQGAAEVGSGGTAATVRLSASGTGAGVVAGVPTDIGGGIIAGQGAAVGVTAASDIGWAIKKLYQLNIQSTRESDVNASTNQQIQSAHQKSSEAPKSNGVANIDNNRSNGTSRQQAELNQLRSDNRNA